MSNPADQTDSLREMMDAMQQVVESASGYRERLEKAGFNETAAEVMATDFHRHLLLMIQQANQK